MVSYLPIFYFSSTVSCSSLPVVWSDVLCRVQCHHLPHHHLRPHGNEPRPRCQVQCPSDCHGHCRHHQPGGHPHSRRDLRHGGCLAHRTGWDLTTHITASVLLMCITLGQLISFFGCPSSPIRSPTRHESLIWATPGTLEKLFLSVSHHRDFL